jgi:hypothetical protein
MSDRNAPCPCGSGRRYKHCHGRFAAADVTRAADVLAYAADANAGTRPTLDFVVAGTQRGGTTALDQYLREHPGVDMPRTRKELHFFDHDEHFVGAVVNYDGYHAHFGPRAAGQARGEVTPGYMDWTPAAERLARYNPALKVVVLLRDPIARAHSHWNKERERGSETLPFLDALRAEAQRRRDIPPRPARRFAYTGRGFYGAQLDRLAEHFPAEQMLVLRSEALHAAPAATLGAIADFLGVAPFPALAPKIANARPYEAPMPRDAWFYLATVFRDEIGALEGRLGWDCRAWLEPPPVAR